MNRVALGFAYRSTSPSEFIVRAIRLWTESEKIRAGGLIYVPYRHWLYEARNQVVRDFLKTDAEALMFVDTDMLFTTEMVERLIYLDVPVAAGAYMFDLTRLDAAVTTPDGIMTLQADPLPEEPGFVDYAGTGFMLIKREVFEAFPDDHWFEHMTLDDGTWLWEDWSFCNRVRNLDIQIVLDPTVKPGHIKSVVLEPGQPIQPAGDIE